uniref:Uncharacterized protein n=1 Tax=Chaetoceros debilis TaxID=122233 RepID=A0A7S3VEE3_9STRA
MLDSIYRATILFFNHPIDQSINSKQSICFISTRHQQKKYKSINPSINLGSCLSCCQASPQDEKNGNNMAKPFTTYNTSTKQCERKRGDCPQISRQGYLTLE